MQSSAVKCSLPDAQMEQKELPLVLYVPSEHAISVAEGRNKKENKDICISQRLSTVNNN